MSESSARLTLRQLCGLGVPGPQLLPSLLPVLREVVKASHGAFFYCTQEGAISNLYAERLLTPASMASYYDAHSQDQFKQPFLQRVAAPEAVSRRSVGTAERKSAYYEQVLGPLEIEHFLYAIVRHHGQVLGQLSLYRGPEQTAFNAADERELAAVLHYLGEALAVPAPTGPEQAQAHRVEEGLAVLGADGQELFADEHWPRLLRLAKGDTISPAHALLETHELPKFVAQVMHAVQQGPSATHEVATVWGRFVFKRHALLSSQGEPAHGLVVSRLAAQPLQLAQGAAALALAPQQREVALLMAQGHANAEIAQRMGVSVDTVAYHARRVFERLGVHARSEVGRALGQAAGNEPSTPKSGLGGPTSYPRR